MRLYALRQHQRQHQRGSTPIQRIRASVLLTILCFWWLPSLAHSATEKSLLAEFYEATRGDGWNERYGWKSGDPVCSWYGVSCEGGTLNDDEGVTRIDLNHNNLNGTIPEIFWQLPNLVNLNLRGNLLTSASLQGLQTADPGLDPRSPLELMVLSENLLTEMDGIGHARETLRNVNVSNNQLDRELPVDLFELTNLETLHIAFNPIPGTLPTLVGRLSKLTELFAFRNRFTGQIPSEIGLLGSCQVLSLADNFWTGTLPTDMNLMVDLMELSIHRQDVSHEHARRPYIGISGALPSFGDMPRLTLLLLDGNSFSGTIPSDFLLHNDNQNIPVTVGLANNSITGTIPKALERFDAMNIDLVGNFITGIPDELCEKSNWMGGFVEEHKCDAILCAVGTSNENGRATWKDSVCLPCEDDDIYPYFGSTSCEKSTSTDSISQVHTGRAWDPMKTIRYAGDLCHALSVLTFCWLVRGKGNAAGVSLQSHQLYLLVFVFRYIDLFTSFYSWYNTGMKAFLILFTAWIVYSIRFYEPAKATYLRGEDSISGFSLVISATIFATLIHLLGSGVVDIKGGSGEEFQVHFENYEWESLLWTVSIVLEPLAMIPQLYIFRKNRLIGKEIRVAIFLKGAYRCFYILNWIHWKNNLPGYNHHVLVSLSSCLQILMYLDFFIYHFK
jgi:ER lumen protein retaining receptor